MYSYCAENLPNEWGSDFEDRPLSQFSQLLRTKWDKIHDDTDAFRYKLNSVRERIIDKKIKYLLHLNPDRGARRRHPEEIDNICQPFESSKFNFTKVSPDEVMFNLTKENDSDIHKILVNVSPISRYHSLLCPSVNKCLPQIATRDSIKLAIEIMFLSQDRDLRIGFNSLCALASVNHLHYHLLIEKSDLPAEVVKCKHIKGPLYCFDDSYPVPAFCFQIKYKHSIPQLSEDVYKLVQHLLDRNIAHNILVTRGHGMGWEGTDEAIRVVIWPRKASYGLKVLTAFNVAVCELSGWFPVYNDDDFVNLQTEDIEIELKKWKLHNFEDLCMEIKSLY